MYIEKSCQTSATVIIKKLSSLYELQLRMYIEKSCQTSATKVPTPWKEMAKSLPLWSILIAHCGQNWGFWTLMTMIPTYMKGVLNFDIAANGLLSAAPYFALWVLSFFFSYLTDTFINRKIFSIAVSRKIVTNIGLIGPAVSLVILGLIDSSNKGAVIALLIIAVGINSAIYCGYQVNHIDIAPNHAGTLMGITNGAANILSICAPLLVQFVVTNEEDDSQWTIVWFIAAAIYAVCDLAFTFFGKGELLYWNDPEYSNSKDGNTKKSDEKSAQETTKGN
ncbi:Major Facilitator Superfamily [Popillia japonica]|uniref:Major Facilitator Superfamily n=2 Tax=Popillia japonica TaxID=7064 RepID=A0AAW1N2N0_POPJA